MSLIRAGADPAPCGVLLTAFTCGWVTLRASFFIEGEPGNITAPATVYLIDHPDGLALFDTGFGPRFQRRADGVASGAVDFTDDADVGSRLRAIEVDPASIRWVINSHLHTDHAGGNLFLPNATIVVQEAEWAYARAGGDRNYHLPEFDLGQPTMKVRGEHDLFGDGSVVLFPTSGHTPGHQSARVRTMFGEVILAADCCNLRKSLDEMRLPDHCFDAEQYLQTLRALRKMRENGAQIFYGHDPEFWAKMKQNTPLSSI